MTSRATGDAVSQAFVEVLVRSPARPTRPTSLGLIRGLFRAINPSVSCSRRNLEIRNTWGRMERVVMDDAWPRSAPDSASSREVRVTWPVRTVGHTKCTVDGTSHTSAAAFWSQVARASATSSAGKPTTPPPALAKSKSPSRLATRAPLASKARAPCAGRQSECSAATNAGPVASPARSARPSVWFRAASQLSSTSSSKLAKSQGRTGRPTSAEPMSPLSLARTCSALASSVRHASRSAAGAGSAAYFCSAVTAYVGDVDRHRAAVAPPRSGALRPSGAGASSAMLTTSASGRARKRCAAAWSRPFVQTAQGPPAST
mmetsp:Transcript_18329/g.57291  ORF Transcript_18329/g.57291 Transcript_18329/m.57291 type:complete len:317 (+) Transcript_18329:795-1745(+)